MQSLTLLISAIFSIISSISCIEKKAISEEPFDFNQVYTLGLHGNMSAALNFLDSIPNGELTDSQIIAKEKYIERFREQNEKYVYDTKDSLAINVVEMFHSYWKIVLLDDSYLGKADAELENDLADLLWKNKYLNNQISKDSLSKNLYVHLNEFLRSKGFYSNAMGKTGKFYDLFLWANETEKRYDIKLPEKNTKVKVIFLEDFISNGWSYYATFGVAFTGGWATKDALFCVKKAWDVSSENFKVSYLTHEAQHFEDNISFPLLSQADLEYRAKLTELSTAKKTIYEIIENFIKRAKNNRENAHAFANYCVIRDLSKKLLNRDSLTDMDQWKNISYTKINKASKSLLINNAISLKNAGTEIVTEFIK
ncbi:MAG: hypothetical protein D8M58_17860 [Calditrichaeota bacterium]|nr:MAG: hypothetical protein DWQ03_01775 [Calditrichota bacterium]MBL1207274.1 hypothetical protein [Calditrichota bacterium]NOG47107.1 hypothetical protein [Calditrichota bacterium]